MPRHLSIPAVLLFLGAVSVAANPSERTAVWEWMDVPKVVAIGDLHGSYDKLVQLLEGTALVDGELRWTGGEAHLVVAGDFLDRGTGDRPVMDLLRRLQEDSEAVGGRVHVLLGNHEAMNLLRDTSNVHPTSCRDFAEEESKKDRQIALASFRTATGRLDADTMRTFNERFPRGYFARQKAFDREGEYGSWLLRQPAVVKVNDIVYLHGGLTEEFASLGVDGINRRVLDELRRHLEQRELLESGGVITPVMRYQEVKEAATEALRRKRKGSPELRQAAQTLLASANTPILGARGPLWYRGSSFEDERIEGSILDRSLELVGAKAMVVAHSYTGGNRITTRFHGQLYRLDHGIHISSRPLALIEEQGDVVVLNSVTKQLTKPVRESPNGVLHQPEAITITDRELEKFLAQAPVTTSSDLGRGETRPQLVVLQKNGHQRRGIFKVVEEAVGHEEKPDRYQHEVAAYRLDRKLGLGLVPVAVVRTIDGLRGSLQWWVPGAVDHEAAVAYELDLYETEVTHRALANGEVFDALIGNDSRESSDVLCLVNGERVFLIDHSEAFSLSPELPVNGSAPRPLKLTPELAAALRSLDRKSLEAELGNLLSDGQIQALLERRDRILAQSR